MKVQAATLQGSGRSNQDAIVVTRRAAAVLDGASSWLPQPAGRDGGWYARELGAHLARSLDSSVRTADLVAEAIASLRDRFSLVPGESPETTVTVARWDDETVEVYALGDSPAVLIDRAGDAIEVCDSRLQAVGLPERARYREHLAAGLGYGSELDDLLAQLQRIEHRSRNRPGGYWVAEAVPEAAFNGLSRTMSVENMEAVLLLTDGAAAGVPEYGNPSDWLEALDCIRAGGVDRLLSTVHETEVRDPGGRRWPRAKRHDDKSVVLIEPERLLER